MRWRSRHLDIDLAFAFQILSFDFLNFAWTFWHSTWQTSAIWKLYRNNRYCTCLYLLALTQIVLCVSHIPPVQILLSEFIICAEVIYKPIFPHLMEQRSLTTQNELLSYYIGAFASFIPLTTIHMYLTSELRIICESLLFKWLPIV